MAAVVVMILTGIDHVESSHPECHRRSKQQYPRIERPTNRDPSGRRSNAEREAEKQMRPARESLAIGIKKDHRQSHRRKQQRQTVLLGCGENKNSARDQNERTNKRRRQLSDRKRASSSARIGRINRGVGQPIEGHGGGPRRNHGHDNPCQLPPRRQASGGQHGSAERKREREDRVFPLDHLQRDLQIAEKSHHAIVKQRLTTRSRYQRHKPATFENRDLGLSPDLADQLQFLAGGRADRHHHASAVP